MAELDYKELEGFAFDKERKLREWQEKKEQAEYDALFKRLYARNWARKERARDSEKVNERLRKWREANKEKVREQERQRRAAKRVPPEPRPCVVCGELFTPKRFKHAQTCSTTCRNKKAGPKHNETRKAKRREAGIPARNMELMELVFAELDAHPWSTLRELADAIPEAKYGSIATKLTACSKTGEVIHDGAKKYRRYALPGAPPRE